MICLKSALEYLHKLKKSTLALLFLYLTENQKDQNVDHLFQNTQKVRGFQHQKFEYFPEKLIWTIKRKEFRYPFLSDRRSGFEKRRRDPGWRRQGNHCLGRIVEQISQE